MRLPPAGLFVILLSIFLVWAEARPGSFGPANLSSADGTLRGSVLQRKILQDQQTTIWTEAKDDKGQTAIKQVAEQKWEPKAENKKQWVPEPKVEEKAELKVDQQTKVEENKEPSKPAQEWKEQRKVEETGDLKVDEKKEDQWKQNLETSPTEQKPSANEKDEQWQELKTKLEDKIEEPWKETTVIVDQPKVELKEEPKVEQTKEEPKVEESKQEPKVEQKEESPKAEKKIEELKVDEKKEESKVEERKEQPKVDEKKEEPKVEERKEEPKVEVRKEEPKVEERKEEPKVEDRKEEPKVEDRKEEPKVEDRKEEPKVEERKEQPKVEGIREEPKVEKKEEPQIETKEEPKVEIKEEPKIETKEEPKVENKEEPKDETKEEPKVEVKVESRWVEKVTEPKEEDKEEPKLGDKKDEPKVGDQKAKTEVEEKKGTEITLEEKDPKVEEKVALQLRDEKEEQSKVEQKDDTQGKDEKPVLTLEATKGEDKLVDAKIGGDGRSDRDHDLDEDYPDFLDELRNFPETFQKTAESVKDHIRYSGLDLNRYSTHSKELFNQANHQIEESFTPLLGKDYAPFIAYVVSYGLFLLPLLLVMYFLDRIRAIFSLQKILLFVNIYLSAYFAALLAATFILDSEPMDFFMKYSSTSYIFLQLVQAFGYLVYLLLNTVDLLSTCSAGRVAAKFSAALQWIVVVAVGFHYYVTVFHRAMARKAPITSWKIYGLYSISFVFLCLFARIERGKKQYTPLEEDDTTDKKN